MAQLPFNDDLGSEVVRKLVREFNALKADYDALKAVVEGAADFAGLQTDTAAYAASSSAVSLKNVPPRNRNYA